MREHALPQDVTGYRFHIIGNMTLKQFVEVGAGCVVGFIIYSTNLSYIIKWPLVLLAVATGAMAAFVPFEERPLDTWILVFFQALYRPTKFYWEKMSKVPEPFLYKPKSELHTLAKEVDLTPAKRQRVKEYLHSITIETQTDIFDQYRDERITEIMGVFQSNTNTPVVASSTTIVLPETSASKTLGGTEEKTDAVVSTTPSVAETQTSFTTTTPPAPTTQENHSETHALSEMPQVDVTIKTAPTAQQEQAATMIGIRASDLPGQVGANTPAKPKAKPSPIHVDDLLSPIKNKSTVTIKSPDNAPQNDTVGAANIISIGSDVAVNTPSISIDRPSTEEVEQSLISDSRVMVPQSQGVAIQRTVEKEDQYLPPGANFSGPGAYVDPTSIAAKTIQSPTQAVVHNAQLPFPEKPQEPNRLVGMAVDKNNSPLANTIIEILTPDGLPARAVKTNILGQFFITTPLTNGQYTIAAEKDGYTFSHQQLDVSGKILEPIEVRSA
jgi:hypothetical protein